MRILHLPANIASQIYVSVRALRNIGEDARGIVVDPSSIQESEGLKVYRFNGNRAKMLGAIPSVFAAIYWADVLHWHFGATALPRYLDLNWARLLNKPGVVEFWGSDIRIAEIASQGNPYLAQAYQSGEFPKKGELELSFMRQEVFATAGYECILSCNSLDQYIKPGLFKKIHFIRQRIEVNSFEPCFPSPHNSRPLIVHSPSNPSMKGTAAVIKAVEDLKKKNNFDFQLITGMPHRQAMEIMKRADIYLDQFLGGAHGIAALEAMALGKPVLCYIEPFMVNRYPQDLPIINANLDNLADVLQGILLDGKKRHNIGVEGRAYVEKYHDVQKITPQLMMAYKGLG
jgi:hypothetical protein